jgi:hypothetical protein
MPKLIWAQLKIGQQVWYDEVLLDFDDTLPASMTGWQPQVVVITGHDPKSSRHEYEINRVAWVPRWWLLDGSDFKAFCSQTPPKGLVDSLPDEDEKEQERSRREAEYYFGKKSQPIKESNSVYCGCETKQPKHIKMDTFEYDFCCACEKEIK